ncbi:hypothetical protein JCM10213_005196 [Rhodosporidiobolus nylandii]
MHRNHFRKDWQSRVKTWFNQPGKKHSRRVARQAKAVKAGLRPTELLRPAVRAPTVRYNRKLRAGRGFTKQELSAAGIRAKEALSIGIPVDHRRRNKSEEGLKLNVERLEQYKARLVVFPKKAGKVKKGDTEGASKETERVKSVQAVLPIPAGMTPEQPREVTAEEKDFKAYEALRKARSDARLVGVRAERKRKAEEEELVQTEHGDLGWLSYERLDPAAIEASVRSEKDGAVVSFVGYTRDNFQGRTVTHLTYESYIPLALKTLRQILLEARSLPPPPPLAGVTPHVCASHPPHHSHAHSAAQGQRTIEVSQIRVAHLLGPSPPLTPSIVICVSSPHRREAFYLTEWLLEEVKKRVQVWKREWYADENGAEGQGASTFAGKDGEGPEGMGGRAHEGKKEGGSKWKENFPPESRMAAAAQGGAEAAKEG